MKSILRALAILVVSCALGLAVYTVVQPMSPSVSFAPEGNPALAGGSTDAVAGSGARGDVSQLQGASGDEAAAAQSYGDASAQGNARGAPAVGADGSQSRRVRPAGAPTGGPGGHPRGGNGLVTVLLVLAKFALAFLFIVIARFLLGKIAPKKAAAQD